MIDAIQGQSQIKSILPNILQRRSGGKDIVGAKKASAAAANANDKANKANTVKIDTVKIDTVKIDITKIDITKIDIKNTEKQKSKTETPKVNYNELSDKLKTIINSKNLSIEFSRDEATKKMILKIIDLETQEIVRQFPPEITLKIARFVSSTLNSGNLTNAKV